MAQWQALLKTTRPTVNRAVVCLGLVIFVAGLSQIHCPLEEVFYTVVRGALRALPSVVLTAWQALQSPGCAHGSLWQAFAQVSGCGWTLLLHLVGAV